MLRALLAFATAGAAVAAFLPVAHADTALYGLPVSVLVAASLAGAGVAAWIAGLAARPRVTAAELLFAVACVVSVSVAPMGATAFLCGAVFLAAAAGLVAAALAASAATSRERVRLAASAALGAAVSTWLSVHTAAPWLGLHGTAWSAAGVALLAALVGGRKSRPYGGDAIDTLERGHGLGVPGSEGTPRAGVPRPYGDRAVHALRSSAVAATLAVAGVAWMRALAATLTPTPTVFAACAAAPLATLALGAWIGLPLARRARMGNAVPVLLFLAAAAMALPMRPFAPTQAVAVAFGGPNTATYAAAVLGDALLALGPACLLAGMALSVSATWAPAPTACPRSGSAGHAGAPEGGHGPQAGAPRPYSGDAIHTHFLGGAIGAGASVVLGSHLGAVPGATIAASAALATIAATVAPRRLAVSVGGAAIVALLSVIAVRLGDLPSRCEVLHGVPVSVRWDTDAFRATCRRGDGATDTCVDSIVVSGSGREWAAARLMAHLGALLVPDARTVLLAGRGRDEARQALLTHGGPAPEEAEAIRPALSRPWDLVLDRAPILGTWGAGSEYAVETYGAAREALTPRGLLVQEVPIRTTPLAHLKRVLAGFVRAFPEGTAWFAHGSLLLVGGRGPVRVELSAIAEGLGAPRVYADLSAIGVWRPWDLLGGFLCDAKGISSRLGGIPPLSDDEPSELLTPDPAFPSAYVDGLAWLLEGRQGVGGHVVAGATRGERWLAAGRLDRLRRSSALALAAHLDCERLLRAAGKQEAGERATASVDEASQALRIDPGDRRAWETLSAAAARLGQRAEQHAKAPPAAPADPPPASCWEFQPTVREQEVMAVLDRLDTERGAERVEALLTFESLHDPTVAPLVAELSCDPDPIFRATVAGTLERLGSPAGAPALVGLLRDPEWNVRRSAAQALGAVGGKGEVPALIEALGDPDASVREAAYAAIAKVLRTPLPTFQARAVERERRSQIEALRAWWERR